MKRIKSVLIVGLVLACVSLTTSVFADGAEHATKANVRAVHGTAQYSVDNGPLTALHTGTQLPENSTVKTGPNSYVDIAVNGYTSVVHVTADTTLTLKTMKDLGAGDTETLLNVANGEVLGSVKKISKGSRYEVQTPRGVAGIRGTDWAVQVSQLANGLYSVTFTSVTGTVIAVANVDIGGNPTPITQTLVNGQSWTPPQSAPNATDTLVTALTAVDPIIIQIFNTDPNLTTPIGTVPGLPGGGTLTYIPTFVPPLVNGSTVGGNSTTTPPPQEDSVAVK
jgi:FecR protein